MYSAAKLIVVTIIIGILRIGQIIVIDELKIAFNIEICSYSIHKIEIDQLE